MADDARIEQVLAKDEITAVIHRVARGTDRLDRDLIISGYWADGFDDHNSFRGGPIEFADWVLEVLPHFQSTHHFLGQCRIEVDGEPYLAASDDTDRGVLTVAHPLAGVDEAVSASAVLLAVAVPLALGLVALVMWMVATRALAPVERLRRQVDAIDSKRVAAASTSAYDGPRSSSPARWATTSNGTATAHIVARGATCVVTGSEAAGAVIEMASGWLSTITGTGALTAPPLPATSTACAVTR